MKMKWFIPLFAFAVIEKEAFGEGSDAKTSSRSSRSLSSANDIYKLDHFIELVEKIERHPLITGKQPLKVIANYIRNLGYNNQKWNKLLGKSESLPDGILTTDEKRVLRRMIYHSFSGQQEQGVVNTPFGDVAMGRVINGICAGITRNKNLVLPEIYGLSSNHIDNLYAATISGDIAETALMNKIDPSKPLLGPGGNWSPNTECPEVFSSLTSSRSGATDAEILGGIDGFLMGLKLPEWWSVAGVRLGQLLRMYYYDGVTYDKNYAACRRFDTFQEMASKSKIIDQATLLMYATKAVWNEGKNFSGVQNSAIPKLAKTTTQHFFTYMKNLNTGKYVCPRSNEEECNLPANLVFVMDESGSIESKNYEVEKEFVKNITEAFDISPYQTRVAVIEYSDKVTFALNLNDYSSKSTVKCAVERLKYDSGYTYTSKAIQAAHDILNRSQSEAGPEHLNDPQIMVLLTDGKSTGGKENLRRVVEHVKKSLTGLTMVAVGIGSNYDKSELELIATDPKKHVFTARDFSRLVTLVKTLRSQTCKTSVTLNPRTTDAQTEGGKKEEAQVSGYVSPGKARYFTLPADTLFKTQNISIQVKPTYGTVTLYVSRTNASPGPDNHDFKLEVGDASISRKKRSTNTDLSPPKFLQLYNLCKGYNETTCPPLYFAVVGKNSSQSCSDRDCSVPTQIKFEIKTEQIAPKSENVCYFELKAEKIYEAKDITVKVSAVKDTVSFYISRVPENPDLYNNSYKMKQVEAGQTRTITISKPCAGFENNTCPPVHLFFRGAHLMCKCSGRNCTLPSQVDIDVHEKAKVNKLQPKANGTGIISVCHHQLSPEQLFGHKMVEIKVSPVQDTIALYTSRSNRNPDKTNHTLKMDPIAVGQTKSLNISRPCSGYDRTKCPPVYLTFTGNHLLCNCTGENGKQRCTLPVQVSIILTKGDPSAAMSFQKPACLISLTLVFLLLFK